MLDRDELRASFEQNFARVLAFAQNAAPREACGLLVRLRDGSTAYLDCRNIAPEGAARDSFKIHPEDWASAEDLSEELLAIVHSHPDADCHPSHADRWMCHESGLPWFIVALPSQAVSLTMPDQPLPLLEREFHHGIVDCYTLVRDYYREQLQIELPNGERADDWWQPGPNGEPGQDLYRKNLEAAGFVDLGRPAGRPDGGVQVQLHDVLLMKIRSDQENHAGVFIGPVYGVDCMLHHPMGGMSRREPWGGVWLNRCTAVARHRSLL